MEPRTSQLVFSKLSSLLSGGSEAEANLRQYWMPDDISLECYECTSIGYDDEPGGNCSDSQPGGKVVKYCTIVFLLLSLYLLFLVGVVAVP